MKKLLYLSLAMLVAATVLPSCNKKLKKEIDELSTSVDDLKAKNEALEGTLNNINGGLEANNPLDWTFTGNDGATVITGSYSCKYRPDSKADVQYIGDDGSDIWYVYVEKSEDMDWEDYAYIELYKNVVTGAYQPLEGNNFYGEHYIENNGGEDLGAYAYPTVYPTHSITVNTFDLNTTTGDVTIDINWSNTDGYMYGDGTESGKATWSGNCFIYR